MLESKKDIEQLKKWLKKCICPKEEPFDATLARSIILKTHEIKGAHPIWQRAEKLELKCNKFTMWKFCLLIHKILHDGHHQVLQDSTSYRGQLQAYFNFWSAQTSDPSMRECVLQYCNVLHSKILFHQTYPRIKSNFGIDYDLVFDVNSYFELCLDMCDYLENLLKLQRAIFTNLAVHNIIAESKKGQCRSMALVTIIEECDVLYHNTLEILQILHMQLSPEVTSDIRERFSKVLCDELRNFFDYARSFESLSKSVEIPKIPMDLPNLFDAIPAVCYSHEPSAPFIMDLEDY
uniref:ENTH domain-containing protein n=1 Tax=Haematobia irritans TaxID=7368 RepID=A0A1L8EBU2_HAEIR